MVLASRITMRMICLLAAQFKEHWRYIRDEASWQKIIANGAKDDCSSNEDGEILFGPIHRDSV